MVKKLKGVGMAFPDLTKHDKNDKTFSKKKLKALAKKNGEPKKSGAGVALVSKEKRRFFVIDAEGNTAFNEKKKQPEHFKSQDKALKRANKMANAEPGTMVYVAEAALAVTAKVSKPERLALR